MRPAYAAIIAAAREQPGTVSELASRTNHSPLTVRDAIKIHRDSFQQVALQRRRQPGQARKVWGVKE
jgi:hypothetical protein